MEGTSRTARVQRTQWTAQFLAASELVRNGYVVSFTMGNNTPIADLMVAKQDGSSPFWVDVKGLASNNAWMIRRRTTTPQNLFYILVRVGEKRGDDRFFVLNYYQVSELDAEQDRICQEKGMRHLGGFLWNAPLRYENNWSVLPGWPSG